MLDGLKVSGVSKRLTVKWCNMHVEQNIHGAFEQRLGPMTKLLRNYVVDSR